MPRSSAARARSPDCCRCTGRESLDGWLARNPFGFTVLDRESGEFFLRTKNAVFPGLTIAEIFGISDGALHEEIGTSFYHGGLVFRPSGLLHPGKYFAGLAAAAASAGADLHEGVRARTIRRQADGRQSRGGFPSE